MKILHILDHSIPLHSGYTFRTRAILEEQRRLGWETFHITGIKQMVARALEEEIDGLHFFRTPLPKSSLSRLPLLDQLAVIRSLSARLDGVVRQVRPDILHAHSPALNGMAALSIARRFNIPLVYEIRAFWEDAAVDHGTSRDWGVRYRATRALETHVLKRADAVTTICEGLRDEIVGRGVPGNKVTVVPNAVNVEKFSTNGQVDVKLKQELGLQDARVLGFIGSFYAYEGLHLLLKALPGILKQAPDVRVLLVGGGPQEANLQQLAAELNLADKVIFTGRVPHAEVQRYYDLVDVLVYPRLSMRLTELVTPLKPLEAMAQGRLLIAADVGGHQEVIKDGETRILFRAGDAADLAGKTLDLMTHEERWPSLKEQGRRFVERERNWVVSVGRYRQVYEAVAGITEYGIVSPES
jgi:PEP-CTERM/exosortase A-associated glycosyltransferase